MQSRPLLIGAPGSGLVLPSLRLHGVQREARNDDGTGDGKLSQRSLRHEECTGCGSAEEQ